MELIIGKSFSSAIRDAKDWIEWEGSVISARVRFQGVDLVDREQEF